VTTGVVVGSILLAADEKLGVEQLAVLAGTDLVNGRGVEIDEQGAGDVFAGAGLGEEGLERARVADVLAGLAGTAVEAQAVLEEVAGGGKSAGDGGNGWGGGGLTAPRPSYPAGYRPGRGGGGGSEDMVSSGDAAGAGPEAQGARFASLDWTYLALHRDSWRSDGRRTTAESGAARRKRQGEAERSGSEVRMSCRDGRWRRRRAVVF
jgi:hypothetical protein